MVLLSSLFLLAGTASASRGVPAAEPAGEATGETCSIATEPGSFIAVGEFGTNSSIADVIKVECNPEFSEGFVTISAEELYSRCDGDLYWAAPYEFGEYEEEAGAAKGLTKGKSKGKKNDVSDGSSFTVELDDDGNATAVVWGGPSCAAGSSLVSAHMDEAPYETVTTTFTVEPPKVTGGVTLKEGLANVAALPSSAIEDDFTSSVATIVNVEFPAAYAEQYININAAQLWERCLVPPYLTFVGPDGEYYGSGEEINGVQLDDDGNAFIVLIGSASCAQGSSQIEASLERAPYYTVTTHFTVEAPQTTPF